MIVFLFVCIGFLYQLKDTVNKYEKVRNSIHQDLIKEFNPEDRARLGARIEEDLREFSLRRQFSLQSVTIPSTKIFKMYWLNFFRAT